MQPAHASNRIAVLVASSTIAVSLGFCSPTPAQVNSRAEEIQAARQEKAKLLEPDEVPPVERYTRRVEERVTAAPALLGVPGLRVKLGGLATSSGFALGLEMLRPDLAHGEALIRASALGSTRAYQKYDLQFSLPNFANDYLSLDFHTAYFDFPQINYFGPGPGSKETSRTNFRLENTSADGVFGYHPVKYVSMGASAGYLLVNVGSGTNRRLASADEVFTVEETPGIDRQADFARYGVYTRVDYRDNPGGPRSGGLYQLQYNRYVDQTLGRHNFGRLDLEVQQYIPFFNKRRVISLRGKSVLSFTDDDRTVPFYLQPVLGGGSDLRGFRSFRFYDDNMLVVNTEYRWESFSGLDMALFFDAGKVFPRPSQWNFHDLETSAGFGFRFNIHNTVFMRIDVGFSHEGTRVWVKFDDALSPAPVRLSSPY